MEQNTSALEQRVEHARTQEATTSQLRQKIEYLEKLIQEKDGTISTLKKMSEKAKETESLKDELKKSSDNLR